MKLKVNAENRYNFIPDIADNRKLPESERFVVVLRRLNATLNSGKWASYETEGGVSINMVHKIKDHIIEFKNPPMLDDGSSQFLLTPEILLSEKYGALNDLIDQIVDEINKISQSQKIEIKKS
jgi:hypothetical protein